MEPISTQEQPARPGKPLKRKPPPARLPAEQGAPRTESGNQPSRRRAPLAAVAVALSVLLAAACGGVGREAASAAGAKAGQGSASQEGTPAAKTTASAGSEDDGRDKAGARAGEAVARDGVARAGDAEAGTGGGARAGEVRASAGDAGARAGAAIAGSGGAKISGNSRMDAGGKEKPRKVTVEITGDRGTEFSGACSVGGTERTLDGRAPGRYVFEPRGKRLECELGTENGGSLGVVLTDGASVHSEQRTSAGESTVKFTYSNGSISSSISSVSEGRSVTYSDDSSSEGSR